MKNKLNCSTKRILNYVDDVMLSNTLKGKLPPLRLLGYNVRYNFCVRDELTQLRAAASCIIFSCSSFCIFKKVASTTRWSARAGSKGLKSTRMFYNKRVIQPELTGQRTTTMRDPDFNMQGETFNRNK